ncbi:helix-turn-helix transcriptional regulator [Streptomyces sp. NRRL F-5727]|uniref:helix-turn-helix transcriptional regulator n=1 Tax=Streptomyces sp. NRRL F-5727 TaxID=1463871 RepID=UPI00068BF304|nr:response regulator transcription factor [Streptomyces sp. NRRL F-5727]
MANKSGGAITRNFDEWLHLAGLDRPGLAALVAGLANAPDVAHERRELARAAMVWLCAPTDGRIPLLLLDVLKEHSRTVSEEARRSVLHAGRLSRATSALVARATADERPAPDPRADNLTSREYDILRLIGSARTNRQIATLLRISEKTVKNHITSLFAKLQASDRTEALVIGLRRGLLSVEDRQGGQDRPGGQDQGPSGPGGNVLALEPRAADWDSRPMAG